MRLTESLLAAAVSGIVMGATGLQQERASAGHQCDPGIAAAARTQPRRPLPPRRRRPRQRSTPARARTTARARAAARSKARTPARARTTARARAAARRPEIGRARGEPRPSSRSALAWRNRFGFPDLGIGARAADRALRAHPRALRRDVDWFEIISENYMQTAGRPLDFLDQIAERYPIVMHGVSLSIGSTDPLDCDYLAELKALRDRMRRPVGLRSSLLDGRRGHEHARSPADAVHRGSAAPHRPSASAQVQDFLEAPLALENPSTYVEFAGSTMTRVGVPRARSRKRPTAGSCST